MPKITPSTATVSSHTFRTPPPRTLTRSGQVALGITAGMGVTLVIQPLTTLRTLRMNNRGFLFLFERNILKTTRNYYRGLQTNTAKIPPYITLTFSLNEYLQVEKIENPFAATAASAGAGAAPTFYSNIFDHVVTRQQLQGGSFMSTVRRLTYEGKRLYHRTRSVSDNGKNVIVFHGRIFSSTAADKTI